MTEHKKASEESVEQNIDYIPKSKLGDLPVSSQIGEFQKQMEKIRQDVEKFKKELSKKFKYIEAVGIIPSQVNAKIEEEYEISEQEAKRGLIHIVTLIPEENFKEIGKVRLEAINIAKEINDKLWIHLMTHIDIWNLCLDSKFDIAEGIAMSFPVVDKGILGAIRVAEIHKTLVLKKFEKYVTSYVIGGSMLRGTAKPTSDIDVFIVIDDTDVKRMPRLELKEKLRGIIQTYIQEAITIAGVKNTLHVQTYLLTEFWEGVKDASPVMFTFIRDGIPLYDRSAFLPWKALLKMGKIKPSPESIDMFMRSGEKLEENVDRRLLDIVVYDLFWGINTPSQALLMLYGQPPSDVYGTVKEIREIFVNKEKILEKKYADILEEIAIKYYKGWEHGKIKKISGTELDRLYKNSKDYMKRLQELRIQIEKRVQEKTIEQVYKDVFSMLEALLKKKGEKAIIKRFDEKLIKTGKFPDRFLKNLKFISKVKNESEKEKKKKSQNIMEIEEARKAGTEIVNALVEYTQRCDFLSMDRTRFIIRQKNKIAGEIFFLGNTFFVQGNVIKKLKENKFLESNQEELRSQLLVQKNREIQIDFKALDILKQELGDFELIF